MNAQHTVMSLELPVVVQTMELIRGKQMAYHIDHGRYATSLKELDPTRSDLVGTDYRIETSASTDGYSVTATPGPKLEHKLEAFRSWGGNLIPPTLSTDHNGTLVSRWTH